MLINTRIVQKHAEDAAFLWVRRNAAVRTNHYTFQQQLRLDHRVDANLDGLRIAGAVGWSACLEQLTSYPEEGQVFAASVVALASLEQPRIEQVMDRAYRADDTARAFVSALGYHPFEHVRPLLVRWLASKSAFELYHAVAGFAVHRRDPGARLSDLCEHPAPRVKARAMQAAAELARKDLAATLYEQLFDETWGGRASLSLAALGIRDADVIERLIAAVETERLGWQAASLLAALDPTRAISCVTHWSRSGRDRAALATIEGLGDVRFMPDLIRWMGDDDVAHLAGETFRMMTGVDLDESDLQREPARSVLGDTPHGCPQLDGEHDLSRPSQLAVARWWREHENRFSVGTRYVAGLATGINAGGCLEETHVNNLLGIAQQGRPRQRCLAAMQLQLAQPKSPSLATHAFLSKSKHALLMATAMADLQTGRNGRSARHRQVQS
jgi:uncharacterized protein (TIGR02270 family)